MEKYIVNIDDISKRLDVFVSEKYKDISRSKLKSMIEKGNILLNNKKVKASLKLALNDVVDVNIVEEKKEIKKQNINLDIIYEDKDLLVVNKPRGMVVHIANGNDDNTLVNALLFYLGDNISTINGEYRAGIVHRIDKDTSGLLVVAKTDTAHEKLSLQLKNHSMTRIYTLICHGQIEEETVIETHLCRNPKNKLKYMVSNQGKYSYTTITPIKLSDKYTYAKAILKTGRTHQIRVHLRYINHPIVGDITYSNYKENIKGQLLHAGTLGFVHPKTDKYMEFTVQEPEIFIKTKEKLKLN